MRRTRFILVDLIVAAVLLAAGGRVLSNSQPFSAVSGSGEVVVAEPDAAMPPPALGTNRS